MCICTLAFSLSGCALLIKDNSKTLQQKALKVGTTVLSQEEVVNLWYSFYTENAYNFYGADEQVIVDAFYKNVVLKYAIIQEFNKLKAPEKGLTFYTDQDEAEVWNSVFEYIAGQIDSHETAIYAQQGIEGNSLPTRLQEDSETSQSKVKNYLYTEYTFDGMKDYKYKTTDSDGQPKVNIAGTDYGYTITSATINKYVKLLKTYLFEYKAEGWEEREEDDEYKYDGTADFANRINNSGKTYYNAIAQGSQEYANRKQAYEMYVSNLLLTQKASGENKTISEVLYDEVARIYKNYYENYLYSSYTKYIRSLIEFETIGGEANPYYALSDENIVLRYLIMLGRDEQMYQVEENYIAVVEAEATDTLLLYHYNGEDYYFSVQHLLVSFDSDITDKLADITGSNASADEAYYEFYKTIRQNFYKNLKDENGNTLTSWADYKNAIYRDENGYDVFIATDYTGQQSAKDKNGNTIYISSDGKFLYKDNDVKAGEGDDANSGYYWEVLCQSSTEAGENQKKIEVEGKYYIRTYLTNAELEASGKQKQIVAGLASKYGLNLKDASVKIYFDKDYIVKLPGENDKYQDYISGYYFDALVSEEPEYVDATYQKVVEEDGKTYLRTYLLNSIFEAAKADTITVEQVLSAINDTYSNTISVLNAGKSANKTAQDIKQDLIDNTSVDFAISEDLINTYLTANADNIEATKDKIFANLFMQQTFRYSSDTASLGTSLKNYVGMIISGTGDNHTVGGSTYVSEFTDGARALLDQYITNKDSNNFDANRSISLNSNNIVITDYGIHILIINDAFKQGKVTGNNLTYDKIFITNDDGSALTEEQQEQQAQNIKNAADVLRNTYVCAASSQTLYEYVYEQIRDEMIGSSGTLVTAVRNNLYDTYINGGSDYLVYYNKLNYDQFMDLLG